MLRDHQTVACFLESVKTGSFSKAARSLGIATSTVAQAVADLEKSLGHQLIFRIKKGMKMTDAGKLLYKLTDQPVQNINEALKLVSGFDLTNPSSKREKIRIVTTAGLMSLWILKKLEKFIDVYPNIEIQIDVADGEVIFSETVADVGILPSVMDLDMIRKKRIAIVNSRIFCSKSYISKYGRPKNLRELKEHRLIGFYLDKKGYRGDVDWHLKVADRENTPDMVINSAIAQLYAAKLGYGIIAIPKEFPFLDDSFVDLFPEQDAIKINSYFITRKEAVLDKPLEDLYLILKEDIE